MSEPHEWVEFRITDSMREEAESYARKLREYEGNTKNLTLSRIDSCV